VNSINLIFATGNTHKAKEIAQILNFDWLHIKTLRDIGYHDEIEETGQTLEENAKLKTKTIYDIYKSNIFSEDTGLEVQALNMEPGVFTARYAGAAKDADANMNKLLSALEDKKNRTARFRTVLSLVWDNEYYLFEGIANGNIARQKHGKGGFGYDPIFIPEGYDKTFAELSADIKNSISHRGRAVAQLKDFLEKN